MKKRHQVRYYDYVNHPYERVRDLLTANAVSLFHAATQAAASRTRSVASELRVDIAGIDVGTEISVSVRKVEDHAAAVTSRPVTRLEVEWEAAKAPRLFPVMKAEVSIYPLTPTETQLELSGLYEPPLGAVGSAIDAVVGHRIAEASVHRFVTDVAAYLRTTLTTAR
jgi:hypothetical protein